MEKTLFLLKFYCSIILFCLVCEGVSFFPSKFRFEFLGMCHLLNVICCSVIKWVLCPIRLKMCVNKIMHILQESVSSSEDIFAKTKSVIELKKLQLLELQRRLRRFFIFPFVIQISIFLWSFLIFLSFLFMVFFFYFVLICFVDHVKLYWAVTF